MHELRKLTCLVSLQVQVNNYKIEIIIWMYKSNFSKKRSKTIVIIRNCRVDIGCSAYHNISQDTEGFNCLKKNQENCSHFFYMEC